MLSLLNIVQKQVKTAPSPQVIQESAINKHGRMNLILLLLIHHIMMQFHILILWIFSMFGYEAVMVGMIYKI